MQVRAGCSNNIELNPTTTTQFEFIPRTALMPVAMIAASCTPTVLVLILSWSLVVVVGVVCILLLHPAPICADLRILHPDLCTLCLRWLSPTAAYGGGVSLSPLTLVVFFLSPTGTDTIPCVCTCVYYRLLL